jgi:hypothetical protein
MKTITFKGQNFEASVTGSLNASGGLVSSAFIPELNDMVYHRQLGDRGLRGFFFMNGGNETKEIHGFKKWTIGKEFSISE